MHDILIELQFLSLSFLLVSAFYAENFNKQISFNAHIWTKSKFLGLSVGVENIGQGNKCALHTLMIELFSGFLRQLIYEQFARLLHVFNKVSILITLFSTCCVLIAGCVSVLPYDEDYVLTFPNGYGR